MPTSFEDLRVLKLAEAIADAIYKSTERRDEFARDVVGKQITRAADSIGANIAEAYGRFHFGERIQFLYHARGSVFETKYWLNRALQRGLISPNESQQFVTRLTSIARQLNLFISSLKGQRSGEITVAKSLRENLEEYTARLPDGFPSILFDETDLVWLKS